MTDFTCPAPIYLDPLGGPSLERFCIDPIEGGVLGRAVSCSHVLPHPRISRRHATIECHDGRWVITDLGGTNGTMLNNVMLEPRQATELEIGDRLRLGPWTLRLTNQEVAALAMPTTDDTSDSSSRLQRLSPAQIGALAEHRLSLVIDCAAKINQADDEASLSAAVLESALQGTGYRRAALIRAAGATTKVEVISFRDATGATSGMPSFSRSLLSEAAKGEMVCLLADAIPEYGQSVAELSIHSALCCPVRIGDEISAFLYVDAREGEARVAADAASFCQVLARIGGLAMANLHRVGLQQRQKRLEIEVSAAREAQEFMLPRFTGTVATLEYAVAFEPGRWASGDLVDVLDLGEGKVAIVLGDVSGKGTGAAILMAAAQSYLHGALLEHRDPALAVAAVNRYITDRSALDRFLSLFVGVFDHQGETLTYVDAGHAHWISLPAGQSPQATIRATSNPVGIDPGTAYANEVMSFPCGHRLVVYTDGVVEQRCPEGEMMGVQRIVAVLSGTTSPEEDAAAIMESVHTFAGGTQLSDDTTIMAIGR
jgi:sigma-B regulation protein RsbU (phosphoserine phosphatase)